MEQLIRFFRRDDGSWAEGFCDGEPVSWTLRVGPPSWAEDSMAGIREELFRRLDAGEEPVVRFDGERYEFVDEKKADMINAPPHYRRGGVEVIDAIEAWGLGYRLGNVIKYVARAGHKGSRREDLEKARWYLDREIERS